MGRSKARGRSIPAIICPRPGNEDEELVRLLKKIQAQEVTILSRGYISATINSGDIPAIEPLALVHPKQPISNYL